MLVQSKCGGGGTVAALIAVFLKAMAINAATFSLPPNAGPVGSLRGWITWLHRLEVEDYYH